MQIAVKTNLLPQTDETQNVLIMKKANMTADISLAFPVKELCL